MSTILPCLIRSVVGTELRSIRLGHPLLDDYLEFVGARARKNTLLAAAYDLKVFFTVIAKEPTAVTTADVFSFIKAQRSPRRGPRVVRLEDGEAGLSVRTIKRRLATVSGLFDYLVTRGDAGVRVNPVPRGMAARRAGTGSTRRGTPLLRAPRTARPAPGRGRRPDVGATYPPRPGDGRGDAARRVAPLRGPRAAAR